MSIVKLNNRSVKDITQFGSITSLGSLTHIATQTASSSASLSFTSGIDSTYKEYIFYFVNIHAASNSGFSFNFRDGGTDYDATKTTTHFYSYHNEAGSSSGVQYSDYDLAQSTAFQTIGDNLTTDADHNFCGYLHLFDPSSTTFVKHFMTTLQFNSSTQSTNTFCAGYCNVTTAIDAVQFKMSSGNIDSGQILLFGLN